MDQLIGYVGWKRVAGTIDIVTSGEATAEIEFPIDQFTGLIVFCLDDVDTDVCGLKNL